MLHAKAKRKLDRFKPLENVLEYSVPKLALYHPVKVLQYYLFKKLSYDRDHKGRIVNVSTFFGDHMNIVLPASLDLFFFGLKSHPSEISLSKYMCRILKAGDFVIDIGAHFGYYTLLMSRLVGAQGRVVAIEASPETFKILKMNTGSCKNVEIRNMAVCDVPESRISFYVFPFYFSELNTLVPEQYDPEGWIHDVKPEKVEVPTITIEAIINENRKPRLIKIDVEGAEDKVMNGSMHVIESLEGTDIIMEYNVTEQHQQPYIDAENSLRAAGYEAHFIDHDGSLVYWSAPLLDYMKNRNLRSENVVFKKKDSITR